MRALIAVVVLSVSPLAGCFDPDPIEGAECTPDGVCPEGQICAADNRCYADVPPIRVRKRIDLNPTTPIQLNNFTVGIIWDADADLVANAAPDGSDISFTLADGVTPLDFEIERYDGTTGALVAWVRITELVPGTPIFMYYGGEDIPPPRDPAGAWSTSLFSAVWHLTGGDGMYADSTSNERNAVAALNVRPAEVEGIAGGGLEFDGIDDLVTIGGAPLGDDFGEVGISFWFKQTASPPTGSLFSLAAGADGFSIARNNGTWEASLAVGAESTALSFGADRTDEWVLLSGSYFDFGGFGQLQVFVNGVSIESGGITCATFPCFMTTPVATIGNFAGIIDEVRISQSTNTTALFTHFENLTDPASFFSVGPQEAAAF